MNRRGAQKLIVKIHSELKCLVSKFCESHNYFIQLLSRQLISNFDKILNQVHATSQI